MKNLDIRLRIEASGIRYVEIAERMGISRVWLSRLMARDLDSERRKQIIDALEELKQEKSITGERYGKKK